METLSSVISSSPSPFPSISNIRETYASPNNSACSPEEIIRDQESLSKLQAVIARRQRPETAVQMFALKCLLTLCSTWSLLHWLQLLFVFCDQGPYFEKTLSNGSEKSNKRRASSIWIKRQGLEAEREQCGSQSAGRTERPLQSSPSLPRERHSGSLPTRPKPLRTGSPYQTLANL